MENLKAYIKSWNECEGVKPCNDDDFIDMFLEHLKSIDDCHDVEFDGEGSYFGKQVTICKDYRYTGDNSLSFEVSFSDKKISVYKGNHQGFWVPEYIEMDSHHPRFKQVKSGLFDLLVKSFGLNDLLI